MPWLLRIPGLRTRRDGVNDALRRTARGLAIDAKAARAEVSAMRDEVRELRAAAARAEKPAGEAK